MSLLIKRGQLIAKGKFDDLHKVNKKLEQLVVTERVKIERPVAAFITFES